MKLLSEIYLNPKNPRLIKDTKFKKLVQSLKDFPKMMSLRPIIIDENNMILGGNMRYKALQELGYTEVSDDWVKKDNELTEEEKREFIVKDNIGFGDWDYDSLSADFNMEELSEWGLDSLDLGMMESQKEIIEDEVPEVGSVETRVKLGDIWQLGRHRLLCGDCTDVLNIEKLMNSKKIDMVFTDPPYGIDVAKNGKVGTDFGVAKKGIYIPIKGDDNINISKDFFSLTRQYIEKFIIWGGNYFMEFLPFSDGWLIWDKRVDSGIRNSFADGEMAWCSFHTPIRIYKQLWNGMIREGEHEKRLHPTQKPIKILSEILQDFSKETEIIYDGFLGSGSTLIACEQTNRICYGCEISPQYCDIIISRWEKFTSQQAILLI